MSLEILTVPAGACVLLVVARLALAPYWMYQDLIRVNNSAQKDLENSNRNALALADAEKADLKSKLAEYEATSLRVKVLEPINAGLIGVRVINQTNEPQLVQVVGLRLTGFHDDEALFRQIAKMSDITNLPHLMAPKSRFEVRFAYSRNGMLQHGAKRFHATVEMSDEREFNSPVIDLPSNEHSIPAMFLQAAVDRDERITGFVAAYEEIYQEFDHPEWYGLLRIALRAGAGKLRDNSELREAEVLIEKEEFPIPISMRFYNDELNISDFFREPEMTEERIKGTDGKLTMLMWILQKGGTTFQQITDEESPKPPLLIADKAEPPPEPSSPECPETDTHCSDC